LEKLAGQLEIRINTVWAFKHKVLERIEELEERGKRPTISRWEEVILSPQHNSHKKSGSDRTRIHEN
jgi:two-component system, sensor histidine kinase LadS